MFQVSRRTSLTLAGVVAASTLLTAGTAGALQSSAQQQGPGPQSTVVGYLDKGPRTISAPCGSDVCVSPPTTPLNVDVPAGSGTFSAHVSISLDYVAEGKSSSLYIVLLRVRKVGSTQLVAVTPAKRLLGAGRSSTSIEFWVKGLAPGTTYTFTPAVDVWPRPQGDALVPSLVTNRVLTRVDVLPSAS